jgi:choline dehydrogenase-like flavoprotein
VSERCDVVVVGAGPAGVCAAWPLVEAGLQVTMIDAGRPGAVTKPASLDALTDATTLPPGASPRVRQLPADAGPAAWARANRITCRGFSALAALAQGGLSTIWGASVATWNDTDLEEWPITAKTLPYAEVAARIGISGPPESLGRGIPLDPPIEPIGASAALADAYRRRAPEGLSLDLARSAVIRRDRGARRGCTLDMACALGCPIGAIYDAADDLAALRARHKLRVIEGAVVELVTRDRNGWTVITRDTLVTARNVVLAAGVLASTRLALLAQGRFGEKVRLLNAPAMTLAFLMPRRIGAARTPRGYGMAQLCYEIAGVFGLLYNAESFLAEDIAASAPIPPPGFILPALLLAMQYFPGALSNNFVRLERDGSLSVEGGTALELPDTRRDAMRAVRRAFRPMGAWCLVTRMLPPGAEAHYAGTLPMGAATTVEGELKDLPGLYVADGSVLPSLSAKSHTFTVMANATRIGAAVAARLKASVA